MEVILEQMLIRIVPQTPTDPSRTLPRRNRYQTSTSRSPPLRPLSPSHPPTPQHSLTHSPSPQALIFAHTSPTSAPLFHHTRAVIFFGTPHKGSDLAGYGHTLARILSALTFSPAPTLLIGLSPDNDRLGSLTREFIALVEEYGLRIYNFYETRAIMFGKLVSGCFSLEREGEGIWRVVGEERRGWC